MKLNEAVALITGGAQGIGRLCAQRLMEQGTKVIVADIDDKAGNIFREESAARYGDNSSRFIKCDVADGKQLNRMFEEAKATYGRLDIISNNAGILTHNLKLARHVVDVNLKAVIQGTYKGIELMSKRQGGDGGVIVNIGSAAGIDLMMSEPVFTSTKHAVARFSEAFKKLPYFFEDGVRVNTICPFFCKTRTMEDALAENPEYEKVIRRIGMVTIDEVAVGFMKVVGDDDMNGETVVVTPSKKKYKMS